MRFLKLIFAFSFVFLCLRAQEEFAVNDSQGPPKNAYTALFFYSGSNLQYVCYAKSTQLPFTFTAAQVSIAVSSNVATVTTTVNHGLQTLNQVTVSGSATSALNGTYQITQTGATTFTFTTSGVSNGTYTDAAITTTAPRSSAAEWAIQQFQNGSNGITLIQWAYGVTNTVLGSAICDNRASIANYQ